MSCALQVHLNPGVGSTAALRHLAEGIISAQVGPEESPVVLSSLNTTAQQAVGEHAHFMQPCLVKRADCLMESLERTHGRTVDCAWFVMQGALEDKLAHVMVERDAYAAQLADLRRYQGTRVTGATFSGNCR